MNNQRLRNLLSSKLLKELEANKEDNRILTVEEAREELGFLNYKEFSKINNQFNNPMYPRRSGRTTRMLIQAVVAAQYGKVKIIGHTRHYGMTLVNEAKRYAIKLNIDPNNITPEIDRSDYNLRGANLNTPSFYDHWVFDKYIGI